MTKRLFTCACCEGTFETDDTEADTVAHTLTADPDKIDRPDDTLVCEPCGLKIIAWRKQKQNRS